MLDLVNIHDEVIKQLPLTEIRDNKLQYYRATSAFIRNSEGKLWIPRRTPGKRYHPNGLDFSVAGHVTAGESYEACFIRETEEELGLILKVDDFRFLGKVTPTEISDFPCFLACYEIVSDSVPDYNRDDFSSWEWLSPEEIIARIDSGKEPPTKNLPAVLRYFGYCD